MTKFLLDTGAVDSVADSLKELSTNARDVMRSVSKYDVENDDGFNFSSAKDAVSTNVSSAYIKFRLTNQYLKKVVSTHTELQESINGGGQSNNGTVSYQSGRYGGYGGGSGGAYGASGLTFNEETVTGPSGKVFVPDAISLAVLKELLAGDLFTEDTIEKLNMIKEKVLVLTLSKKDDNYKEKLELAEELSKVYDIDLVINEKEEEDVESSLCIVKNGIVLASTTELTDIDAIKAMFDKVNVDVEDEEIEIEPLPDESDSTAEDKADEAKVEEKTEDSPNNEKLPEEKKEEDKTNSNESPKEKETSTI